MKLVNLVSYFIQGGTFEGFCKEHSLNVEAEVIEIYAQTPVSLESILGFFPIEETEGQIVYHVDGAEYQNLFDFFYFTDVIEEVREADVKPSDGELARSLLSYSLDDA